MGRNEEKKYKTVLLGGKLLGRLEKANKHFFYIKFRP